MRPRPSSPHAAFHAASSASEPVNARSAASSACSTASRSPWPAGIPGNAAAPGISAGTSDFTRARRITLPFLSFHSPANARRRQRSFTAYRLTSRDWPPRVTRYCRACGVGGGTPSDPASTFALSSPPAIGSAWVFSIGAADAADAANRNAQRDNLVFMAAAGIRDGSRRERRS